MINEIKEKLTKLTEDIKVTHLLPLVAAAMLAVGCGGGGGKDIDTDPVTSEYKIGGCELATNGYYECTNNVWDDLDNKGLHDYALREALKNLYLEIEEYELDEYENEVDGYDASHGLGGPNDTADAMCVRYGCSDDDTAKHKQLIVNEYRYGLNDSFNSRIDDVEDEAEFHSKRTDGTYGDSYKVINNISDGTYHDAWPCYNATDRAAAKEAFMEMHKALHPKKTRDINYYDSNENWTTFENIEIGF